MERCFCCRIAKGEGTGYQAPEYVVELDGGWILNHCGEKGNTYLGYLVLATKEHVEYLHELTPEQATTLGMNIKRIDLELRRYWSRNFDDPIERIHVAYLNEGAFIKKKMDESHVHLHILPRTQGMMPCCNRNKIGWQLLDHVSKFPEYLRSSDSAKEALMMHFRHAARSGWAEQCSRLGIKGSLDTL